jgi:hypothetical protein
MPTTVEDQKGNGPQGGSSVSSQLPPPLNWVAGFIDSHFAKMPGTVQVIVFSVFCLYFVIVSIKFFLPEVWDSVWENEEEIQGVLTRPNWEGVVDSTGSYFLSGTKLYVTKDHPNPGTPKYYFRWILKVNKNDMNNPIFLSLMEGALERGTFMITPKELLDRRMDGYVRLEFKEVPLTGIVKIGFQEEPQSTFNASQMFMPVGVFLPQTKESYIRKSPISADSVAILLRRILRPEYSSAELNIRKTLLGGGTDAMRIVADSLRSAVFDDRKAPAAVYALVLSDFYQLYLFSTSESYSRVFADPFYEKASQFLLSTNEKQRNYMATLLHNLQDARSLRFVFEAYDRSTLESSKGVCLYVIEAFTANKSTELKKDIIARLERINTRNSTKELQTAVERLITKFQNSFSEKTN